MKFLRIYVLIIIGVLGCGVEIKAQLIKRAGELIHTALSEAGSDSIWSSDSLDASQRYRMDSIRFQEMALELQELKLNEIVLRSELERANSKSRSADSLKRLEQMHRIDSLREVTPGVPVVVDNDTLFIIYAARGGYSAHDRAAMASEAVVAVGSDRHMRRDTLFLLENTDYIDIMLGTKVIVSVTDQDAMWQSTTRHELAEQYLPVLDAKIRELRDEYDLIEILKRVAMFVMVILAQYLLLKFTNFLFHKLQRKIVRFKQQRLKPVVIRDYELLNTDIQGRIMLLLCNLLRYAVLLIQFTFSVPILFAIFPQTENLALKIFLYIVNPIKMVVRSVVEYIPNLFMIMVICICIRYIIKGVRYISGEIANEKLKISGFYPDWAWPTFNIIRFLLYAFMIAMIYPYLPGAESGVFQGISVFVGLIVSLGSSAVIGNIISGLVITYMRPFRVGDRIKLGDTTGNVIEKTPFATRLRTLKNEVVTIPNSFILSSHTVNYSASARKFGLIVHTNVTVGYEVPWRLVHQLLINAARLTPGVLDNPKPFVLENDLPDDYSCYQINVYIKDADRLLEIRSELHQNIHDVFEEAGVELVSPHYFSTRDGSASTIPPDTLRHE